MYRTVSLTLTMVVLALLAWSQSTRAQPTTITTAQLDNFSSSSPDDLYNLGPIGGKASLKRTPIKGVRVGLVVKELVDNSPGKTAGLEIKDIIIGSPKNFKSDAYLELAVAIELAESQRKEKSAVVKLRIIRKGKEQYLKVNVKPYGKESKTTPTEKMRNEIVKNGIEYIAKQQREDGGWRCGISQTNGRIVMTSLCGMAFLAAGNTPDSGEYKQNITKAIEFVLANIDTQPDNRGNRNGPNHSQANWGLGYSGMFLAEAENASHVEGVKEKLQEIADALCRCMEGSGGFAHGPGGPNPLDYTELEIVSNYCVSALGGAVALGCKVPKGKIGAAISYIEKCGGGSSGVGYSTRKGQIGFGEVGRTSGAIMAFGASGREKHKYYKKMCSWIKGNLEKVIDSHVSPSMHQLATAAACHKLGTKMWDAYWKAQRQEFTMLRNPDSTFTGRPTEETKERGLNEDIFLGPVWNTAHWTIILCLENDNLPVWYGKVKPPKKQNR